MQTTTVTITVQMPTLYWEFVRRGRTEDEAAIEFLRIGGVPRDWRQQVASYHAARTGSSMEDHAEAVDAAAESELVRLAARPDKPKPEPEPDEDDEPEDDAE